MADTAETASSMARGSPGNKTRLSTAKGPVGPYSRAHRLRALDGRTTLAKHVATFEAGLIESTGGAPPLPVRALISQAVTLETQIRLLERHGIKTDHDRRCLSSWLGAQRHALKAIAGFKPAAPQPGPTLAELIARDIAKAAPLAAKEPPP